MANTSSAIGRAGVRAGVGAAEGFVGAAVVEPIVLLAAEAEQADYGLYDSFMNLTFGTVLGGGLHSGLGAISDVIGRANPQTKEDLLRSAIGRAMEDKPVDVSYVAKLDDSFRAEWRASEIDKVIKGADDVDIRVKQEFNRIMDELRPELIAKTEELPSDVALKAVDDIERGVVPEPFIKEVARIAKSRMEDFESNAPDINAKSNEASDLSSMGADETISKAVEDTPELVEANTNDILTALDEREFDTSSIRSEIEEINNTIERDAKGLREGVMCALGK